MKSHDPGINLKEILKIVIQRDRGKADQVKARKTKAKTKNNNNDNNTDILK